MTESQQAQEQGKRDGDGLSLPRASVTEALPLPAATKADASSEQPATSGGPAPSDVSAHAAFAESVHQYIREYIRFADQKATFVFTGATALLAFLYKNGVSGRWLKPIMQWNILDTVAFVAMIALAAGALVTLWVVIPRTPGSRRGFVFWEAIAEYGSGREYADELWRLSTPSLFQVKAEHCLDLARVCRQKYRLLRCGLWICAVGLAASLVVFLFL